MPFYLFVNGNPAHDEGTHDADLRVTRVGGGPLTFESQKQGERAADALHAAALKAFGEGPLRRFKALTPRRSDYVVATEPPPVSDPQ